MVGTTLADRYQVMAKIGRGSMGGIFRAFDTLTERQVAVKVLKKHLIRDDDLRSRFELEAQALKRMLHKNLIAVRDFGISPTAEEPYIVMEYVDGETLASVLGDLTYIPAERLVPIMVQVCEALIHAHDQGILHRDIKPANIMLIDMPRERDVVKVLDFGLAKMVDTAYGTKHAQDTNPGDPVGTPLYMSPEQARGERLDSRADIYAIGSVMYECLTGIPPITGTGVLDILKKQCEVIPQPMSEVRPFLRIPSQLETIVMNCIKKDRNERFNHMIELRDALLSLNIEPARMSTSVATLNLREKENTPVTASKAIQQTPQPAANFWQRLKEAIFPPVKKR
jgi:serine/threonine-protein kinase